MTKPTYHLYGQYSPDEGFAIYSDCYRQLAKLQIYHLANSLRAGDRPLECQPNPPAGRTLVEFAAAAWTPFHSRYFRDNSVPGHHREPKWLAFTNALETALNERPNEPLDHLTDRVYTTLVESLLEADLRTQRETWEAPCPFGAFRYNAHGDHMELHFHNPFMPDSPFRHPSELVEGLQGIINDISARSLGIRSLSCESWINYLAPFQALFPKSYIDSMTPTTPDNKGGNGWWGQYIDKTGRFNEKRAQTLRDTRQFDFLRARAECPYSDFVAHIKTLKP